MSENSVILLGGGGHALVLYDLLQQLGIEIKAVVVPSNGYVHPVLSSIQRLSTDNDILEYSPDSTSLVNGIGDMPSKLRRSEIFCYFKSKGYRFETIVSPNATVSSLAIIGEGAQVLPGAVVQAGAKVGSNSIINTGSTVDHDTQIGNHCHVAPGVTICGEVEMNDFVFIGVGCSIINGIIIRSRQIVPAGSLIRKQAQLDDLPLRATP